MTTQRQEQRPNLSNEHRSKRPPWTRWLIASIILILIAVGIIIWILTSRSAFTSILPIVIFTVLGVLIALFQWLFPVSSNTSEQKDVHPHSPQVPVQNAPVVHHVQPIIIQVPITPPHPSPSQLPDKVSYRGIVGFPPPTAPRTIQQREHIVREIYTKLIQPNITAIALTGIGGVGKSTLAALIYHYAEEQRSALKGPFLAEVLWLTIDPVVTFADLTGNLFEALNKSLPDLSTLAPQNQAVALITALNTTDKPRLIILDQFENLLSWETGHALIDRPGVGEWLDIINSQQSACHILLTSRPRPVGTREYPPTYLQEYPVGGLEVNEGIVLLRNQGVQGTEIELQTAVSYCAGHAFSLTLLASLVRDHHMNLEMLFKNSAIWTGDIATNLLDQIYTLRLTDVQRNLLLAFSIYREPVPREAAQLLISNTSMGPITAALKTLLAQHLLESFGEGRYQLHAIVVEYAQGHFDANNELANKEVLKAVHAKAAQYYLEQAAKNCPPHEKRRKVNDVHDLIEAVWQYCQAEKWQEAYKLMERERFFADLFDWDSWRVFSILFDLYQLLLPLEKWLSMVSQRAIIYSDLGRICRALGKKEEALKYYRESLAAQKNIGDRKGEGRSLNSIGKIYNDLGQKESALKFYKQALSLYREVADQQGEGIALNDMGDLYSELGQYGEALQCLELALSIYQDSGSREGESWTFNNLGKVYSRLGQKERALDYLEQALFLRKELHRRGEGRTLNNLGLVYGDLGQKEALKYLEQALSILKDVGDRRGEGMTLNNLGKVCSDIGEKDRALYYYKQALYIHKEVKNRGGEGRTLGNIGILYLEQHHYDIALGFMILARDILEEVQNSYIREVQENIDKIHQVLGDEKFITLLATVELQVQPIVDQALGEMQSSD